MTAPSLTREAAEALAARLVGEMIERWRRGERPLAEEFLARHPGLGEHPEPAADLVYEELCLRQEHGPEVPLEQVLPRFPQWRPQLEVLFDLQRLLGPRRAAPRFPAAGESLGDFLLLTELGDGSHGRVFLARQRSLGDRPVVLKLTPCDACEHLALARLQHTHIVPLYSAQDHPDRGLRALCMPHFGGATLAQILAALQAQPPERRTGQDVLDARDRVQAALPLPPPLPALGGEGNGGPSRQALARASYVQAVCWVAGCLADGLQYAHERGLVHLDLKPSNVLLAADGQPMLLDFHLAREPIRPESECPPWLGGTPAYMSPEQRAAVLAVQQGRRVPGPVDGRSDVYSLGVVLDEALGGDLPGPDGRRRPLRRRNPQVSVGLAEVVGKCLAGDPADRYPTAAALAADLRRHLADLPLAGVRNRSSAERWRKWRRRRPHGLAVAGMLLAVLAASGAVTLGAVGHVARQAEQARAALNDAQAQADRGEWEAAVGTLQRGLAAARGLPFRRDLADELGRRLQLAEQARADADRAAAARELHRLADRLRFLYGAEPRNGEGLGGLEARCRTFWEDRGRVVERLRPASGAALEPPVRDDLLDVGIVWADLQVRLAPAEGKETARHRALTVLDEAEALCGPSPVLDAERPLHAGTGPARCCQGRAPDTVWEHWALGRALLRSGELDRAAAELDRAVRLQPQGLWPNFYRGLCAYRRRRYEEAVTAYSVCVGAAPEPAVCFYNRALACAALGRTEQARRDYDQALRLDPTLTAALNGEGRAARGPPVGARSQDPEDSAPAPAGESR
jgi:serine/threonine protein kinase/tetratricopeptide (TPR) repeat protein